MTAEQSGLAVSRRAFLQGLGLTTAATAAHHLIAHADEPAPPHPPCRTPCPAECPKCGRRCPEPDGFWPPPRRCGRL